MGFAEYVLNKGQCPPAWLFAAHFGWSSHSKIRAAAQGCSEPPRHPPLLPWSQVSPSPGCSIPTHLWKTGPPSTEDAGSDLAQFAKVAPEGVQGAQGRGTAPQCRQHILSNTQRRGAQHSHKAPLQFTFSSSVPSPVYKPAEDQVQPLGDQRTGTHLLFTPTPDLLPSLIHL